MPKPKAHPAFLRNEVYGAAIAVSLQAERLLKVRPEEEAGSIPHADAYFFAVALARVSRLVKRVALSATGDHRIRDALDTFTTRVPDTHNVRGILEHWDSYISEADDRQILDVLDPWLAVKVGEGTVYVRIDRFELDVADAEEAARELALTAMGTMPSVADFARPSG